MSGCEPVSATLLRWTREEVTDLREELARVLKDNARLMRELDEARGARASAERMADWYRRMMWRAG